MITTGRPIREDITRQAYARADDIELTPELARAWVVLRAEYPDLPPDEYLPGGARYRFRRWGRFYFEPSTGDLLPLPHGDYFQSRDINRVTGGIVRKFAPLTEKMIANPFMGALIRFNFAHFPVSDAERESTWQVDAHLIRVVAEGGTPGEPTPEGIHRDGAEFVTVHLAELENVAGGEVTIYDNDARPLHRLTLAHPLDSYLFDDRRVLHSAGSIAAVDASQPGVRSILTFDYHHAPALERPT